MKQIKTVDSFSTSSASVEFFLISISFITLLAGMLAGGIVAFFSVTMFAFTVVTILIFNIFILKESKSESKLISIRYSPHGVSYHKKD